MRTMLLVIGVAVLLLLVFWIVTPDEDEEDA